VTTLTNLCGVATTWVVLANTWHVTCFGCLCDLFPFLLLGLRRAYTGRPILTCFSQGYAFWGLMVSASHLRGEILSQNSPFGTWIGILKLNVQNIETSILTKLLHRFQFSTKFCSTMQTTKKHSSSNSYASNKSKMADGQHFKNPLNCNISATVRPILTKIWPTVPVEQMKRKNFEFLKILNIEKIAIFQ